MRTCTKNVGLAAAMIASNTWLLTDDEGRRFLVDCGHALERNGLRIALWRAGVRRPGDLTALLLTHRHCDHAGNAAWVRERFDAPVFCHEADAPALSGRARALPIKRGIGNPLDELLCDVEDRWPARSTVDEAFALGPVRWGFSAYPAFGHTEGSVILYHEPTRTAFTGDAILAGPPPLRSFVSLRLAMACYSVDIDECHRRATEFLADSPPIDTLCSGHGPVVWKKTSDRLSRFRRSLGV